MEKRNLLTFKTKNDFIANHKELLHDSSVALILDTNEVIYNYVEPFNEHEYVDLGLPSGTLWAKCNVGATTETQQGTAFPLNYSAVYDDVKNDMGGRWQLPTLKDFKELLENTSCSIATINNVEGFKLTKNDKYIFFPHTFHTTTKNTVKKILANIKVSGIGGVSSLLSSGQITESLYIGSNFAFIFPLYIKAKSIMGTIIDDVSYIYGPYKEEVFPMTFNLGETGTYTTQSTNMYIKPCIKKII